MARLSGVLVFSFLVAAVPVADGSATTSVTDPQFDVRQGRLCFPGPVCPEVLDPKADLTTVEVWDDGALHIRVATRGGADATFNDGQQARTLVDFFAGGQFWQLRAEAGTPRAGFELWEMQTHEGGPLGEAEGWTGFEHPELLALSDGAEPWMFEATIQLDGLLVGDIFRITSIDELRVLTSVYEQGGTPSTQANTIDEAPDNGGIQHKLSRPIERPEIPAPGEATALTPWSITRGPDLAGGPSIAVGPDGPGIAYYVYSADRKTPVGIYYKDAWNSQPAVRIGDYAQDPGKRDSVTRTHIAFAGPDPIVLYAPQPGSGVGYSVARRTDSSWSTDVPADGLDLQVMDGTRDAAALAARPDRLVVALPLSDDRVAILAKTTDIWSMVTTIEHARLPRLALDTQSKIHAVIEDPTVAPAELIHLSEATGWTRTTITEGVTEGWHTAETDGSYALALDGDLPCFVWDGSDSRFGGQGFGCLRDGKLVAEAAPLRSDHGNPQYTLRLAFDGDGNAFVASGYGGSDLTSVRLKDGAWKVHPVERRDMFDLAVAADGAVFMAYTEPHGGTTVAVAAIHLASLETGPDAVSLAPPWSRSSPSASLLFAIALLGVAAILRRRTAEDKEP